MERGEHHRQEERGISRDLWEKCRRGAGQRHRSQRQRGGEGVGGGQETESRARQEWPSGRREPAPGLWQLKHTYLVFVPVVNTS